MKIFLNFFFKYFDLFLFREEINILLYFIDELLIPVITDAAILPVPINPKFIFIYSKNYFYENWNITRKYDFIEFILPIENIEIIQVLNSNSNNLLNVQIKEIFNEYGNKNTALIFIEEDNSEIEKIFIKT